MAAGALVVVADDYGYARSYDEGIAAAAQAGAIDAVSALSLRDPDPAPLAACAVAVGLHLESGSGVEDQLEAFRRAFGADPTHIDGHHHCHATPPLDSGVAGLALLMDVPVRSVSPEHRAELRRAGVRTADRLLGRYRETDPTLPPAVGRVLKGEALPAGVSEWMVHPGRSGGGVDSDYDRGREEDLELLLALADEPLLREARRRGLGAISASSEIDSSRS